MAICRLKRNTLGGLIALGFSRTRPAEGCCSVVWVRRDLTLGALSFGELFAAGVPDSLGAVSVGVPTSLELILQALCVGLGCVHKCL